MFLFYNKTQGGRQRFLRVFFCFLQGRFGKYERAWADHVTEYFFKI